MGYIPTITCMCECMEYVDAIVNNDNDNEHSMEVKLRKSHIKCSRAQKHSRIYPSIYVRAITLTCYNMIAL